MLTSSVAQVLIVDGARIAIERTASTPELLQISGNDFPAAASNGREPAQFAYLGSDAHNSYLVVDAGERSGDLLNQIQQKMPHKDRKSTRLNSSHVAISYAVFCLKKNIAGYTESTSEEDEPI